MRVVVRRAVEPATRRRGNRVRGCRGHVKVLGGEDKG
jgi:hypothetical protein